MEFFKKLIICAARLLDTLEYVMACGYGFFKILKSLLSEHQVNQFHGEFSEEEALAKALAASLDENVRFSSLCHRPHCPNVVLQEI